MRTETSREMPDGERPGMSIAEFEEIKRILMQGKGELAVNQQILFKHAADLPPARKLGLYLAGWGPIVLLPVAPLLYFVVNWQVALFTVFLAIFWVGMGRKYAQAVLRRQCFEDREFLSFALSVDLVKIIK